jgi:hypothetical protein
VNNQNGRLPVAMERLTGDATNSNKSIISESIRAFEGVLTETGDPQVICRSDGYIAGANSEACRLLGLTREQVNNLTFCIWRCFTQASRKKLIEIFSNPETNSNPLTCITLLTEGCINTTVDIHVLCLGGDLALLTLSDTHQRWLEEIGK